MVYSQRRAQKYGGSAAAEKVENHTLGFYQALVEARVPFEMAHDELLDEAAPMYKLLILPNIAAMSDKQCAQVTEYVRNGGSIVATHETSLYDETGERRKDFGLADVFGCSFGGEVTLRMQNAYLALNGPHPLLKGLEDTPRIIHGVSRVATKPHEANAHAPLLLISSYPDLPMEEVYPRADSKTAQPEVYVRQFGKGRVVYFPFDLDRTYWEILANDHGRLLRNAVMWALDEGPRVRVEGPGLLDVTYWRQENSAALHLVNLTNPMAMRGFVREPLPVAEQKITLTLPAGKALRSLALLESGKRLPAPAVHDSSISFTVPSVAVHEIVAIDFL
jgi:hypothetical protein